MTEQPEIDASALLGMVPDDQLRELAQTLLQVALDAAEDDGARAHALRSDLVDALSEYTPPGWVLPPRLVPAFYQAFCAGWIQQDEDARRFADDGRVS